MWFHVRLRTSESRNPVKQQNKNAVLTTSFLLGVAINFLSSDSVRYALWDCTVVGKSTDLVGSWVNNSSLIAWWIIIFNEAKILCWVDCLRVRFCLPEFADIAEDKYRTNPFRYLTSTSFNRIRSPLYFFRWYINIRREPGTPFLPIFCLLSLTCSMYCIKLTSVFLLGNPYRSLKNSAVLWNLIAFANWRVSSFLSRSDFVRSGTRYRCKNSYRRSPL